jgi:hypothetical protein
MVSRHESTGGASGAPDPGSRRSLFWILAGITLLGALLRFHRIANQSLWTDEMATLNAVNVGAAVTLRELQANVQGPLHAAIVWLVSQVSLREEALRSVSAVVSIATIPVVFLLGRELFDRRAGLLAAFFLAVSPFSIWYAQEVRNYAMLHAFAALSTLLAYRLVGRDARAWPGYVASAAAALYCNLSAAFLVVGQAVFALPRAVRDRRFRRGWLIAYVIIALLFIPTLVGVARWAEKDRVSDRVVLTPVAEADALLRGETTFVPGAIPYTFFAMSYGFSLGPSLRALHLEPPARAFLRHAGLVVPAGLAAAGALLLGVWRATRDRVALRLILCVVAAVFGGTVLAALLNVKPFGARYVSAVLPLHVVLLGAGVGALSRWPRAALAGAIAVFSLMALWNHYYVPEYWKEDVRAATRYIEGHERPGDIVVAPAVLEVFDFYFRGTADRFALYPPDTRTDEGVSRVIETRARSASRIWFIDARHWGIDPDRRIPRYLRDRHELLDARSFPCAELSLFRAAWDVTARGEAAPAPSRSEPVHSARPRGVDR